MSHWNRIENPLEFRKWKPRQPSPELRARIFGAAPEAQAAATFDLRDLTRWIVPAFGCFLLVLATLSNHLPPQYALQLSATNFVFPALTEETTSVVMPGSYDHNSGVNAIPAKKFELNFGSRPALTSLTGLGSILISYTNKLIQY